jgi:hypothetical protein
MDANHVLDMRLVLEYYSGMKAGGKLRWPFLLFLCFVPLTALADAGTPLMWAGLLHLVFGNALIGFGEGIALAFLFHLSRWKSVLAMIVANYFSAWVGYVFLLGYTFKAPELDLYNAWRWHWIMVAATFVLTCFLEWPFVFFCLRKSTNRFKKSIWSNVLVQFVSYVLLLGWYWSASGISLYTQMHVVESFRSQCPTNVVIYFISATDGDVYSIRLPVGKPQKMHSLNSTNEDDRLFLRESGSGQFDVYARLKTGNYTNPVVEIVASNQTAIAAIPEDDQTKALNETRGTWAPQWDVPRIGDATKSSWGFRTGFWAIEGLLGDNDKTGEKLYLAFETPFAQWNVRNAYHLPGDCVVFQLGPNQICALDVVTKRVALLAKGRGPVVMLEGK